MEKENNSRTFGDPKYFKSSPVPNDKRESNSSKRAGDPQSKTLGWKPACKCLNVRPIPCIVLDPFGGSMTTATVAHKHNRNFIMVELSKTYIDDIGIPRIEKATKQRRLFK